MTEFLLTFLLVFSVLQTAFCSDLDFSSLVCFANWFGHVPGPLSLILFDGCSTNRPVLSFQLSGQEGHLPDHVGLLVWAMNRCCSCSFCIQVVRSLRAPSTAPFPFSVVSLSSHGIHIAQLVTQSMRRQQKKHTPHTTHHHHHRHPLLLSRPSPLLPSPPLRTRRWFSLVLQEYLQLNSQQKWSHKSQQLYGWPMEDHW